MLITNEKPLSYLKPYSERDQKNRRYMNLLQNNSFSANFSFF